MVNQLVLIGRIVKDNELRYAQSGTAVLKNTIAVDRGFGKDETDFFDFTAFKGTAENTANYTKKGSLIAITGRLVQDKWETDEGQKRSKVNVIANQIQFLDSKSSKDNNNADIDINEFTAMDDSDLDESIPF